jgi:hypothetical protein
MSYQPEEMRDARIVPLTPSRSEPAPRRGDAGRFDSWPTDIKRRAQELWATVAGRDSGAVVRLLAAEAEPDEPLPSARTVRHWAQTENWSAWSDGFWRETAGRTAYELQLQMLANFMLAQQVKREAMTGGYAGREAEGVLALKAAELSERLAQSGVLALHVPEPPQPAVDAARLPKDEQAALARETLVQRKKSHGRWAKGA